jgi:putative transposase
MLINKAYRYELKPNIEQRISLAKHAGAARFTYNWGLNLRIELYEKEKKSTNAIKQHKLLNSLKLAQFPWMYEVSKCAPQEALRDLDKAFSNFFRGLKQGQKVGFPSFKKRGDRDSFRLTGSIKVQKNKAQLPRLGQINLKECSNVKGKILSATVSREADRWYVSFTVEENINIPTPLPLNPIGIDVGITSFATYSDGSKTHSPEPLKNKLKLLKKRSHQHSKKVPRSKNRIKSALSLSRLHRKIRNSRKDFLHKESTRLAKTKSLIVVEDLDVKGLLVKGKLSRQISDAGWAEFRRMLEYKTKWYGSELMVVPRYYPSSKRCSNCGVCVANLPLKIRQWECPECHKTHDRDVNAAKNILNWSTGSSPGIYACGDSSGGGRTCPASYVSKKQEVMSETFVHKL